MTSAPDLGLRNARAIGWFHAHEAVHLGTPPASWLAEVSREPWWHRLPDRERSALFEVVRDGQRETDGGEQR